MRAYVDKVEGAKAELRLGEDEGVKWVVATSALPKGVKEGDVLTLSFAIDHEATAADADENEALREKLLKKTKDEPF